MVRLSIFSDKIGNENKKNAVVRSAALTTKQLGLDDLTVGPQRGMAKHFAANFVGQEPHTAVAE
jgi:hypothetical protein